MAAAICGAENTLRENTEELLNHIPLIDRCEDIASTDSNTHVHQALVLVYDDLLDFYFEVRHILKSKHFAATLTKSAVRSRIIDIVSSFSKHTESLFRNIEVTTSIMIRQILANQSHENVRQLLNPKPSKEVEIHNRISDRADDACEWISKDSIFQQWVDLSSDVHCVSLIGNMGNGKTTTTGFVVHYLQHVFEENQLAQPAICSYYCSDDNETSDNLNIHRSLVQQLLNQRSCLLENFVERYQKEKGRLPIDPTESIDFLSTFLFDVLSPAPDLTKQATYIIIDGLDECRTETRNCLLEFFTRTYRQKSRVKLFLSHRPDENIRTSMPKGSKCVYLENSKERDHRIAKYLVTKHMKYLAEDIQNLVINDLSGKADGCAIWVRLVVEYLGTCGYRKADPIRLALRGIPSPQRLADLYEKLFEKAVGGEAENQRDLVLILDLLTLTLRPLTLGEVACAVTVSTSHGALLRTFAEIDGSADVLRTRQLARSFIRIPETDDFENAPVSLVHQSLKEVILKRPPNEWLSKSTMKLDETGVDRKSGLYAVSQSCIRYLLLDDPDSKEKGNSVDGDMGALGSTSSVHQFETSAPPTPPVINHEYPELWAQSPIVGTFFTYAERASSWKVKSLCRRFRFYDYAINFWAIHFRQCQPPAGSPLHSLAIDLYKKMSSKDWDDYLQTGNDSSSSYPVNPDALTICCYFGHLQVALEISDTFEVGPPQFGSAFYWASHQGHLGCIKLLHSRIVQDVSFCYHSRRSPLAAAAANGHAACVDFILGTGTFNVNDQDSSGRTALALAVKESHVEATSTLLSWKPKSQLAPNISDNKGWSPLFWAQGQNASLIVSMLLADARVDPNILDLKKRSALSWACQEGAYDLVKLFVADKRIKMDGQDSLSKTPLIYAVESNDLRIVKQLFLRCQSGSSDAQIELKLGACDFEGRNAVSWAASVQDLGILEFLLEHAPEQACVPDENGWLPLAWTLNPPGYPKHSALLIPYIKERVNERNYNGETVLGTAIAWGRPEIAKLIMQHSDIDVNLRDDSGRTPLSLAASAGYLELVKLLIETKAADSFIADGKGLLPLDYAKLSNHSSIVDYLGPKGDAIAGDEQDSPSFDANAR